MKIALLSDLHGQLPEVEESDLILISGDLIPTNIIRNPFQGRRWFESVFEPWAAAQKGQVVAIAGNHDFALQQGFIEPKNWIYLEDEEYVFQGIKIWGTPWQPYFGGWAFNAHEPELKSKWEQIPEDTNILLVHGSPHKYGDKVGQNNVGSPSLSSRIHSLKELKLVVCGHIHVGRGHYKTPEGVDIYNAALVNNQYEMVHKPFYINF